MTDVCTSNIGINGHQADSINAFTQYEKDRTAYCAGTFRLNNATFDCKRKDTLNCTTDWGLYKFPWSR